MRNQRSNFIPVPIKPAKSAPKPLLRHLVARKSSSCQTDRVVLVKEENVTFYPCTRVSSNDGGMRRDYVKAVNYINSCHKFINAIIEKNNPDKNNLFLLPMITNYVPLFSYLTGKKSAKKKESGEIKRRTESKVSKTEKKAEERKSKSSFGVQKPIVKEEKPLVTAVPVGDCEKTVAQQPKSGDNKYASEVADAVKEQVQQFLSKMQEDIYKVTKQIKPPTPKEKCKNLDFIRQQFQDVSKEFSMQKKEGNCQKLQMTNLPPPLPLTNFSSPRTKDVSEDCSVILSDTDCEEAKPATRNESQPLKITHYYEESVISLTSDSSDIKSDSDYEINGTL